MAEIINLNRARKQAAKKADKKQAENNRLLFGRPKAERQVTQMHEERRVTQLDAHRIERPADQTSED